MQALKKQYEEKAREQGKHWLDYVKVKDLKCKCPNKTLYEKITDLQTPTSKQVMAYNSCKHTIFAAAKRQMKAAPTPDPQVADDFIEYSKKIIDKEIGEDLTHFTYSFWEWYAHLNAPKQKKIDQYLQYINGDRNSLTKMQIKECENEIYEGICKIELQATNGKPRMVCSIPLKFKYITGPITWKLEEICAKKFKGYCGGKNLTEMALMCTDYINQGFTKIVEGDGSAFDNTQDVTLKEIDRYIYECVEPSVYHVDQIEFHRITHNIYKTMDVNYIDYETRKKKTLMQYRILGSVFSGDCDTTLCNTLRMALYNRYVNDRAGLVYGKDYIAYSKGDDFTIQYKPYVSDEFIRAAYYAYFLPASDSPDIADSRVKGLGQVLKMLDFGGPTSIKFCSLRAWYRDKTETEIILTRDPKKLFDLSCYSRKIKTMNTRDRIAYYLQQAEAYRSSYKGIHIFELAAETLEYHAKVLLEQWKPPKAVIKKFKGDKQKYIRHVLARKALKADQDCKMSREAALLKEKLTSNIYDNIGYRQTFIKIQEDYWTTMQKLERVRTDILTQEEAQYVNQQINAEFDIEEMKSMLGQIKSTYATIKQQQQQH